jgi:hypothetical protein
MDEHEVFIDQCLKNSFASYNYKKCSSLIISKITSQNYTPIYFYMALLDVISCYKSEKNGFTSDVLKKEIVEISTEEIIEFAKCYKGLQFSEEVRVICHHNHHDKRMQLMINKYYF